MALFLYTADDFDYDEYDAVLISAPDQDAAYRILTDKFSGPFSQNPRDFACRVIDPANEPDGIVIDSYNAG